jgi:predicted nuclease of predicted toxin-antitoxin system
LLKFLIDESTGAGISEKLKQMGFDSLSVIEIMKGAEDIDIIKKAKKENRIIITNDKDFGWLATIYKPPGLILLRLRKENTETKKTAICNIITKHQNSIHGNIIIATEKKIRIRPIERTP